ncbi:MAG: hypothetical protein H0W72_16155, partial [Planctomycetes bacterium]|nr:hypothetical protein [Planctomycetota bacterium]
MSTAMLVKSHGPARARFRRCAVAVLLTVAVAQAAPAATRSGEAGPGTWNSDDGRFSIGYQLAPPPRSAPGRLALVIGCHGNNGDANQLVGPMGEALERAMLRDQYLIIGLKSRGTGWTQEDAPTVEAFIRYALARWPIDPRRVYGIGYSGGSFFLNTFVPEHSELCAGAITWVGGRGEFPVDPAAADRGGLYWINGGQDTVITAAQWGPGAVAAIARGHPVIYREQRDLGHVSCVDPIMADATAWLDGLRNVRVAPDAADDAFLAGLAGEQGAPTLDRPATWARLLAIGGRPVLPAIALGLASAKATTRMNAATCCTRQIVDGATIAALADV